MYTILVKGWESSWYHCCETEEEAETYFKKVSHYYPDTWMIKGEIIKEKRSLKAHEGKLPY